MSIAHIPTRLTVTHLWELHSALVRAAASDPAIAANKDQQLALRFAQERFSTAFMAWDGK